MKYSNLQLEKIYDRTSGYCHLCHKKVALKNYGIIGSRGAWEIDHSVPSACGGTNHGNNLFAACIACNRSKGTQSSKSVRTLNGKARIPLSSTRRAEAKNVNQVKGAILGGAIGWFFGPVGLVLCSIAGASIGGDVNPDE